MRTGTPGLTKFWVLMVSELFFDGPVSQEDLMRACIEDRDFLLDKVGSLYPQYRHRLPAELVRDILFDVCGYFIEERPLPRGQLAVCDLRLKRIRLNSSMADFVDTRHVNLQTLRWSTLAHELGHIRLHQGEVEHQVFISSRGPGNGFDDPRAFAKELEANFYAAVFLAPQERLLEAAQAQFLLRERREGRPVKLAVIEVNIHKLADAFCMSPTLMRLALVEYGWLKRGPGRHDLQLQIMP